MLVKRLGCCVIALCLTSAAWSQQTRSGNRSRTINQRIDAQWIDAKHFTFSKRDADGAIKKLSVDAESGEITTIDSTDESSSAALRGGGLPASQSSATETSIEFVNESDQRVELFWIDMGGNPRSYGQLDPGDRRSQHTYSGHAWMVKSNDGTFYGSIVAQFPPVVARIKETFEPPKKLERPRRRRGFMDRILGRTQSREGGKSLQRAGTGYRLRIEEDDTTRWISLDFGDLNGFELTSPSWSPDGMLVAVWKVKRNQPPNAVTIESSPSIGGRAILRQRPYRLPGDPYDEFELYVFDAESGKRLENGLPKIDFGRPSIHWFDQNKMAVEKVDRGHQRVRLFVVDPQAGETRTVVDETSETFIWTLHGPRVPVFTYLDDSDEVIFASERSGWRHLYLVTLGDGGGEGDGGEGNEGVEGDVATLPSLRSTLPAREGDLGEGARSTVAAREGDLGEGARSTVAAREGDLGVGVRSTVAAREGDLVRQELRAITKGDWLVREIVRIDEEARTIDVLAGEYYDDQDPYHRHLLRVGIDDGEVVAITEADGDHSVQYSPEADFAIVTHSRVDSPPGHELRRCVDGKLVRELVSAERIGGDDDAWTLPKVFHAPGRDGETEIWGSIYFPDDFDPDRTTHYPVIEAIYAGPHDSHVPKRYLHSERFGDLRSLGFVVVQIDGMGTANRSKAFHDVCWHNIKDAGFPDRIAWMKAAAKAYPAFDLSRVGIFGTSAGGQNACGALLFHGDFYKAAYAACGCHDNRMDKASWNEQWMGYPVDDHYAENSNIDNAEKLTGDLFLVVGELDSNVPPESTYRLVDALVKADKDFDFLMIPGMGHSDGGSYGRRKMREFFVAKLRP